jgi:hypothetical protein
VLLLLRPSAWGLEWRVGEPRMSVPSGGPVRGRWPACWGDSESSPSHTKNKRVFQSLGFLCERLGGEIPGDLESYLIFQKSFFGLNPSSLAMLQNELKKAQGVRVFDQADCFLPRRNPRSESCSPGYSQPGIRSAGFVVSNP